MKNVFKNIIENQEKAKNIVKEAIKKADLITEDLKNKSIIENDENYLAEKAKAKKEADEIKIQIIQGYSEVVKYNLSFDTSFSAYLVTSLF